MHLFPPFVCGIFRTESSNLSILVFVFCMSKVRQKKTQKKQTDTHIKHGKSYFQECVYDAYLHIYTSSASSIQCTLVKYRNRSCNQHNPAVKYGFLFVPISLEKEWYNGFAVFAVCVCEKEAGDFCGWSLWWTCFRDFWHHCECAWLFTERDGF